MDFGFKPGEDTDDTEAERPFQFRGGSLCSALLWLAGWPEYNFALGLEGPIETAIDWCFPLVCPSATQKKCVCLVVEAEQELKQK